VTEFPPAVVPVPVLARAAHDRVAHRRTQPGWVAEQWSDPVSRVLVLSAGSSTLCDAAGRIELVSPASVDTLGIAGDRILLGDAGGVTYFGLLAYTETATSELSGSWRDLRDIAVELDDLQVGLMTAAVALQAWHQRHTHCPRCGAVTEVAQSGWSRVCPQDTSEHFPRTDPAVIMLIRDGADRCLLARSPGWPEGRMSVLAGFVEAGESAEAAVAREVREEAGIDIGDLRYVASQPHPFPASLMLGFTARVVGDPTLQLDPVEIAEGGWFTRAEVRRAGEWGAESAEAAGAVLRGLPPTMSIARQLINAWLDEESSGTPSQVSS
jgi:NAD+ diphosphatase